jgi:hypothetical protein
VKDERATGEEAQKNEACSADAQGDRGEDHRRHQPERHDDRPIEVLAQQKKMPDAEHAGAQQNRRHEAPPRMLVNPDTA